MDRRAGLTAASAVLTRVRRTAGRALLLNVLLVPLACADQRFEGVIEPSGIAWLGGDDWIVVDDEPERALRRITLRSGTNGTRELADETAIAGPDSVFARWKLGPLDDLEGACVDAEQRVHVIGSHNAEAGIESAHRRKLVRFSLDGTAMRDVVSRRDLRQQLLERLPQLQEAIDDGGRHDNDLDIEALACDTQRGRLLVGLRAPRLDDDGVVVAIANAEAWLDSEVEPELTLHALDLDKGGIRAMAYDPVSDGLFIASRRESGGGSPYKLWHVPASFAGEPERIRLDDKDAFEDVEGVAADPSGIVLVRDDGGRGKRGAGSWFYLTREALDLDMQSR